MINKTDDALAFDLKRSLNPGNYKTRNSCISGHFPGQQCHLCAHAQLNQYTTGDYQKNPTVEQLMQLSERNDFNTMTIGNIPIVQYLRQFANRQVHFLREDEDTVQVYIKFLNLKFGLQ